MLNKVVKKITNNFGLKVMAFVFAVVLWLVVVNVEDPDKTTTFTVPVSIENVNFLTDMGKTYQVTNGTDLITFTVTGKRSVIEALSESDFTATADMSSVDEELRLVPIQITASRYGSQIDINKRNSFLEINVENLVTASYDIEVVTQGNLFDNCYVSTTKASPKTITVTGPESVVDEIKGARVFVSVAGAKDNIVTNSLIELYNRFDAAVPMDRLSLNRAAIDVDVIVRMRKTVPVEIDLSGELAEDLKLGQVTSDVENIEITGSREVLSTIDKIVVGGSALKLDDMTASKSETINLEDYLPEGVRVAKGQPESINVEINILSQVVKEFNVPVENITVTGLEEGMNLEFDDKEILIRLKGFSDDLNKVDPTSIKGSVDISGQKANIHLDMPVAFENVDPVEDVSVGCMIQKALNNNTPSQEIDSNAGEEKEE